MFRADFSARYSCDCPEMSRQSGEIRAQPGPPRSVAMDSRASHDTYRAAGFASLPAPPAPILARSVPWVSAVTVQGTAAMVPDGAGAVVRAGSVVAPVLLDDGPGTSPVTMPVFATVNGGTIKGHLSIRSSATRVQASLQTDITVRYLQPSRTAHRRPTHGTRVSPRMPPPARPGMVRGDCSLHLPFGATEGTRSGDRRAVSLSPVPAPQFPAALRITPHSALPSRICRLCVAWRRS